MSQYIRLPIIFAALTSFCWRGETQVLRSDDYVARARHFLREMYPGLAPTLAPVIHDYNRLGGLDTMNSFLMELYDTTDKRFVAEVIKNDRLKKEQRRLRNASRAAQPALWCSNPILGANFMFAGNTEAAELVSVSVDAASVSGQQEALAADVNKHPAWSNMRIISAMKSRGAKFTPDQKEAFLQVMPVQDLERYVGHLEIVSAEFNVRTSKGDGSHLEADLTWLVRAKWRSSDGNQEAGCILMFEPFQGKLLFLQRDLVPRNIPQ